MPLILTARGSPRHVVHLHSTKQLERNRKGSHKPLPLALTHIASLSRQRPASAWERRCSAWPESSKADESRRHSGIRQKAGTPNRQTREITEVLESWATIPSRPWCTWGSFCRPRNHWLDRSAGLEGDHFHHKQPRKLFPYVPWKRAQARAATFGGVVT